MPYSHLPDEEQDKQRRIDFNIAFGSETGFRVLQDLVLDACHVYQASRAPEVEFKEGERNIGLYILGLLNRELRAKLL
ncbi:MAG: hypothetical protein A4E73_00333 [Syntrophaceae bacterium PtaU1.Bin231]|nr:MAG: hypothetical protein A4E73_00333 [Syntrophaceae bacterium PtaU1.Bin231]